jgi:hypothetical protein
MDVGTLAREQHPEAVRESELNRLWLDELFAGYRL